MNKSTGDTEDQTYTRPAVDELAETVRVM